jgi:hypothetical protein
MISGTTTTLSPRGPCRNRVAIARFAMVRMNREPVPHGDEPDYLVAGHLYHHRVTADDHAALTAVIAQLLSALCEYSCSRVANANELRIGCAHMPVDTSTMQQGATPSVHRCRHVAELCTVDQTGINVVQLQRPLSPQLRDDAARLSQHVDFRMLATVTPDPRGKQELWPHLADFPHLAGDIGVWVEVFADLMECSVVAVRLARVEHAMCPRLHVDLVSLRLVSTYVGPGTQFVCSSDVDRRFLGHAANGERDERSGVLRSSALISAASAGDIVLLKGERWPGNEGRGAVHRSPEASAGRPRLVVTMDPLWN